MPHAIINVNSPSSSSLVDIQHIVPPKNPGTSQSFFINDRKVPQILSLASKRVDEWSKSSWKWLTRFRIAILARVALGKRLSSRTMREDQREAIEALLKVILSHLDLSTMQVGVFNPETGVFVHLTLEYLAHKAALSYSKAQRAMAWLYEAGYVMGLRQSSFDAENNKFIHQPSIRRASNHLLLDLGITDLALGKARAKCKKTKIVSTGHMVHKAVAQVKKVFSSVFKSTTPATPKKTGIPMAEYLEKVSKLVESGFSIEEARQILPKPSS